MFLHMSHPAIRLIFVGWQSLDFVLWWRTSERGDCPFFVEGLQGLWHSRMIGCGYQDPQCSTVALNLTLVEVMWFLWHFSGLLWVHCYVFPRDCNSSSWKSLTNGPRDCWHSSQPVLDWCCLQPVLPRGLEVFSPNSDLFLPWDICWGGYTLLNSYW